MTRIYIDENFAPQLANGLDVFQQHLNLKERNPITVLSIKEEFGKGALDEYWIPIAGEQKAIVITQDLRIQRTRHQNELYKKHGLGVIFFKPPSNGYSFWEINQTLSDRLFFETGGAVGAVRKGEKKRGSLDSRMSRLLRRSG